MKTGKFFITFLILCVILCCTCYPVQAAGYEVKPAYGLTQEPIQDTSSPSTLWDQSVRVILLHFVLLVSPLLVVPVELLFTLKIFAALGYRKVEQNAVLYNQNRRTIFEAIQLNPGIYFNEICRVTGINRGTLKYHLVILKVKNKISTFSNGCTDRYYENRGRYNDREKALFRHLQETNSRKILKLLFEMPGITQKEIADRVEISGPSVSRHMTVFDQEGLIISNRSGRSVQYRLSSEIIPTLREYIQRND